jgi:S1-C subfamily serine protease
MFHLETLPTISASFGAAKEQFIKDAISILKYITGRVDVEKKDGTIVHGSCFFYSDTFHLLTCSHVIKDAAKIQVCVLYFVFIISILNFLQVFFPVEEKSYPAKVVADGRTLLTSVDLTVLLLEVPGMTKHNLPYVQLNPRCDQGTVVFCAGFAVDGGFHVSDGMVSRSDDPHRLVITSLTGEGLSGGPCVGRGYRNLLGVIACDFGITHHRTEVIPYFDVDNFLQQYPNLPQIERFRP